MGDSKHNLNKHDRWIKLEGLKASDTIVMAPCHTIWGVKRRGWMLIGKATSKADFKTYPLFCTLQTSGGEGPVPKDWDPRTWFRRAVSVMTEELVTEKSKNGFWNLTQLAILHPPMKGLVRAGIWEPPVSVEYWRLFVEEMKHLTENHPKLFDSLCTISAATSPDQGKESMNLPKSLCSSENKCSDPHCQLNEEIKRALDGRKWSSRWRLRHHKQPEGNTRQDYVEVYGELHPYHPDVYELAFDLDPDKPMGEPLRQRWNSLIAASAKYDAATSKSFLTPPESDGST